MVLDTNKRCTECVLGVIGFLSVMFRMSGYVVKQKCGVIVDSWKNVGYIHQKLPYLGKSSICEDMDVRWFQSGKWSLICRWILWRMHPTESH